MTEGYAGNTVFNNMAECRNTTQNCHAVTDIIPPTVVDSSVQTQK